MSKPQIDMYLKPGARVHLIGAGGVSMSALAEVLAGRGLFVTGSDRCQSGVTERLCRLGIPVSIGETPAALEGCDAVIRTAAAREDNPEVMAARARGLPLLERADAWGSIMREYQNAVCVAGTHGKTTTTGMLVHIAMAAGLDPTVMIGGRLPLLGAGHRVGQGDMIILEACEYCNSYHHFYPTAALFLNIEADHLDFFEGLPDIIRSFRGFARLVPENGVLVGNRDDMNVRAALEGLDHVVWFGESGESHVTYANAAPQKGCWSFDVMAGGRLYAPVTLRVPGEHNRANALSAAAAACALGIPGEAVTKGLFDFQGAGRRMEYKGQLGGADIYDDYAHHPTEIAATLKAAREMGYKRVLCAFQPHTYTRTKALLGDFARALAECDGLYLAPIYAAREDNPGDISSGALAAKIPGARSFGDLKTLAAALRRDARPGDIIITAGAGDIYRAGEMLANAQ